MNKLLLIVLYTNDETHEQQWAVYFGGHKEATEQSISYIKEGFREIKRVFINASAFDDGA